MLLGVSLLALAGAVPAHAQQSTAAEVQGLSEITVTAQKRTESAQRVPISIQSMNAAKLDQLGVTKLQDVEVAAPSLSFGDGSEQGRTGIRGIIDYSRNAGYDSRVGVYVDGVYFSRSWMNNQTLLGVAQVDVLRGPQGTLFGKNTDAGVISITTLQPSSKLNGEFEGEAGNFGYWKLAGRVNVPLSGSVSAQLTATHLQERGYYENVLLDKHNQGVNSDAVRGQIRFHSGVLDLTLSGDYTSDDNSTLHYTYVPPSGTNPYKFSSYNDDYANRWIGGVSATAKIDLGSYEITSITAWRSGSQLLNFNNESGSIPFLTPVMKQRTDQFSQELRLASPREESYDFVTGLYYFHSRNKDHYVSEWGSGMALLGPLYGAYAGTETESFASVSTDSLAAFVHANFRPSPIIEIFAGGRFTYEKKRLNDITTRDPLGLFAAPLSGYKDSFANSFFTPKGGVNLFLRRNLMLFATVGRGFKSGGWNVEGTSAAALAAGIRFKPETVTSYEVGLKSDFLDRRARINLTGFYQKFKNFQVFTFVQTEVLGRTVLASSLSNVGVVSSKGIELEVALVPVTGLTLSGNYTYNKSQYDRYPGGGGMVGSTILDANGVQTPYAPEHKAYVSADYQAPVFGEAQLTAHFGYSVQSSENFDPKVVNPLFGRAYFIKGYGLADARIGISSPGGGWKAAIWSKNLFDKDYVRFANRTGVLGNSVLLYGEPRSYGVTLNYSF